MHQILKYVNFQQVGNYSTDNKLIKTEIIL